jgi:hypothetical protein
MHYCPQCGVELSLPDSHFCPECGAQIAPNEAAPLSVEEAVATEGGEHEAGPVAALTNKHRWVWIGAGALVLLIAVVGLLVWNAAASAQRQAQGQAAASLTPVPDLRGMTADQAKQQVARAGLAMGLVNYDQTATGALGAVMSQDPVANAHVRKGSLVVITVVGAQPMSVPSFVGLAGSGAQAAAAAVGLNVISVPIKSKTKAGTVVSQNPTAGASVQPGTSVNIMVAQGASSSGGSSDGTYTPKKGSAERTAIMDACRIYLDYSGLFIVNELKVRASRAFADVTPNDDRAWGSTGLYLLKNGNGWVVSSDSRTDAYRGTFISENAWLFNK